MQKYYTLNLLFLEEVQLDCLDIYFTTNFFVPCDLEEKSKLCEDERN